MKTVWALFQDFTISSSKSLYFLIGDYVKKNLFIKLFSLFIHNNSNAICYYLIIKQLLIAVVIVLLQYLNLNPI